MEVNFASPQKIEKVEETSMELLNSPSSFHSCLSYEDVETSFTDEDAVNGLIGMFDDFESSTSNQRTKRRSSSIRRSVSRKSISKLRTKNLRKSLIKLCSPTKSTTEKIRPKQEAIFEHHDDVISKSVEVTTVNKTTTPPKLLMSKSLTKAKSPNLRINHRVTKISKSAALTSEEIQFNKVKHDKLEEDLRIKKFRAQYQSMKSGGLKPTTIITQSVKTLTVPKTPESHVNKRVRAKMAEKGLTGPTNGIKVVAKKAPVAKPYVMPSRPTQVAPFKFTASTRKVDTVVKKPVALAGELAQKFIQNPRSTYVPVNAASKLTVSEGPNLRTTARCQGAKPKVASAEEREEAAMKEIKSKPFKARVLNRRIFESMGELGVPKVEAKACTDFQGFNLRSDKRASIQRIGAASAVPVISPKKVFKARPMPATTKEPPATPAVKIVFQPTVGISPKMRGGQRASSAPTRRQLPHHSLLEQKREQEARQRSQAKALRTTEPKEFELRTSIRGSMYKEQLIEQLQRELDEEAQAREVKVMPVPDLSKAFQPIIAHKDPTEQQPFNLRSIARHDSAQSAFQHDLEAEEERLKQELFKARPLPKTTYERFEVAEHSDRAPLKSLPVTLTTDARAKKRQEFDQNIQAKMMEIERMQQDVNKQKFNQENNLLKELRRKSIAEGGLCFKATPVLVEDPFPTHFIAAKPLTEPKSPNLRSRQSAVKMVGVEALSVATDEKLAAAMRNF